MGVGLFVGSVLMCILSLLQGEWGFALFFLVALVLLVKLG